MTSLVCKALMHQKRLLIIKVFLSSNVQLIWFHNKFNNILFKSLLFSLLFRDLSSQSIFLILCLSYGWINFRNHRIKEMILYLNFFFYSFRHGYHPSFCIFDRLSQLWEQFLNLLNLSQHKVIFFSLSFVYFTYLAKFSPKILLFLFSFKCLFLCMFNCQFQLFDLIFQFLPFFELDFC